MSATKTYRHGQILRLVSSERIGNQEDLRRRLAQQRLRVTQATLSRDLARLNVRRVSSTTGGTAYELEEEAVDLEETDVEQAILDNENELLVEVQQALARIENGTYGICSNCGQPIPEKRLEAIPWATLCVNCESNLVSEE